MAGNGRENVVGGIAEFIFGAGKKSKRRGGDYGNSSELSRVEREDFAVGV